LQLDSILATKTLAARIMININLRDSRKTVPSPVRNLVRDSLANRGPGRVAPNTDNKAAQARPDIANRDNPGNLDNTASNMDSPVNTDNLASTVKDSPDSRRVMDNKAVSKE